MTALATILYQRPTSYGSWCMGYSSTNNLAENVQRFNNVAILNAHKTRTDALRLVDVANEFVGRNDIRKRNFGTLTDADLIHIATSGLA